MICYSQISGLVLLKFSPILRSLSLIFHFIHPLIFISFLLLCLNQLPLVFLLFSSIRWLFIVLFNFPHICGIQSLPFFFFLFGDLYSFSSVIFYPTASIAPPQRPQFLCCFFSLHPMPFFSLVLFFSIRYQIVTVSIPFLSHFLFSCTRWLQTVMLCFPQIFRL